MGGLGNWDPGNVGLATYYSCVQRLWNMSFLLVSLFVKWGVWALSMKVNRFCVNLTQSVGTAWSLAWGRILKPWQGSEGGSAAID